MKIKIYTSVFLIVQTLTAKNILDFQVKSFKVISNRYGNIESNRTTLVHERSGHVTQLLHGVSPLNIQDLNVNSPL